MKTTCFLPSPAYTNPFFKTLHLLTTSLQTPNYFDCSFVPEGHRALSHPTKSRAKLNKISVQKGSFFRADFFSATNLLRVCVFLTFVSHTSSSLHIFLAAELAAMYLCTVSTLRVDNKHKQVSEIMTLSAYNTKLQPHRTSLTFALLEKITRARSTATSNLKCANTRHSSRTSRAQKD